MIGDTAEIRLTIIITVVSGKKSLRRCLEILNRQTDFLKDEIIVPFDRWSLEANELAGEFPGANFYFVKDLGIAGDENINAHQHRLYDRRRAAGLQIARGQIIAMTEDHALPADDWCRQILAAHMENDAVAIGGAIENAKDALLNWAWYYCDFGRYGLPFEKRKVEYVSDVNVSYKRRQIMAIRDEWNDAYHETLVHWKLRRIGARLVLDEKIIVYQNRPPLSMFKVLRERIEWGRIFAETKSAKIGFPRSFFYAAGTVLLPPLLLVRAVKNMRRQRRTVLHIAQTLPLLIFLLAGWSFGEFLGYLAEEPAKAMQNARTSDQIFSESLIQ